MDDVDIKECIECRELLEEAIYLTCRVCTQSADADHQAAYQTGSGYKLYLSLAHRLTHRAGASKVNAAAKPSRGTQDHSVRGANRFGRYAVVRFQCQSRGSQRDADKVQVCAYCS